LINRTPTPFLKDSSPFEKLYNESFDLRNIRIFGCLRYSNTLVAGRTKLDPRATAGVFLGFKSNTKGYVVFNFKDHNIILYRDVMIHENIFPYSNKINKAKESNDH